MAVWVQDLMPPLSFPIHFTLETLESIKKQIENESCASRTTFFQCCPNPHAQSHINVQNKQTTRTPIGVFVRERAFSLINCLSVFQKIEKKIAKQNGGARAV